MNKDIINHQNIQNNDINEGIHKGTNFCDDLLVVNDVSFAYNKSKVVLKNLFFTIKRGSFHGLIGGNGAGKSTLIKLLIKALNLKSGNIFINGMSIIENNKKQGIIISYFPDNINFPSGLSVYQYLKNEYDVLHSEDCFIKDKIIKYLSYFDIKDLINKNPNRLSSGQKKKIELIRIMLEQPDFIILDEPTNFLDPDGREMMFECLRYLNQKGATILISSHILHELKHYIDSATIIDEGQIKYTGSLSGNELIEIYDKISASHKYKELLNE